MTVKRYEVEKKTKNWWHNDWWENKLYRKRRNPHNQKTEQSNDRTAEQPDRWAQRSNEPTRLTNAKNERTITSIIRSTYTPSLRRDNSPVEQNRNEVWNDLDHRRPFDLMIEHSFNSNATRKKLKQTNKQVKYQSNRIAQTVNQQVRRIKYQSNRIAQTVNQQVRLTN